MKGVVWNEFLVSPWQLLLSLILGPDGNQGAIGNQGSDGNQGPVGDKGDAGDVVGSETNNSITIAANGGAFYESPIKAFGKIGSNGSVIRATTGVTTSRISTGRYSVTLPTGAVSDANYIIQLTQPGRGGAGNDDPGISYNNQTSTGFEVIIGDNDNGGTNRARYNSDFMFTILDL